MRCNLRSAALIAVVTAACVTGAASQVKEGQAAPDFTARTIDGKTIRLSALRGKVVVLDFWTTT